MNRWLYITGAIVIGGPVCFGIMTIWGLVCFIIGGIAAIIIGFLIAPFIPFRINMWPQWPRDGDFVAEFLVGCRYMISISTLCFPMGIGMGLLYGKHDILSWDFLECILINGFIGALWIQWIQDVHPKMIGNTRTIEQIENKRNKDNV